MNTLRKLWHEDIKSLSKEIENLDRQWLNKEITTLDYMTAREQRIIKIVEMKTIIKEREANGCN
jgi:hypothetical protein